MTSARLKLAVAAAAVLLAACGAAGAGTASNTVAYIPGYAPGSTATPTTPVVTAASGTVSVTLGETDASHMYIHVSSAFAPSGRVTFVVTNQGTMKHEFVVLATKTPAGSFPIVSFEGEANRINEDAKGVTNVGETGDMEPGTTKALTIDLPTGHYALLCNLAGHYAAGMHVDFWATPKGATPVAVALGDTSSTQMYIHLSQPDAPAGQVAFIITNESTDMKHELVGFATTTPAGGYKITGFEGEANRINEDTAGKVVVDTGAALAPGASKMIVATLAPGHYALLCNLAGHYAAGMHVDFWATPKGSTPITVALGETDQSHMYIHLSAAVAPAGKVTFLVTNEGTKTHEFVVLATTKLADSFPIVSFEGEANRIDEDAKGVTNVGETGDMDPGAIMPLTVDLASGHYALVCNLPGHYAMGMHQDFWVA